MKYIDEYRDRGTALALADAIARQVEPARQYRFMEFCGGHTHAIYRYGLHDLLPANLRMIHGPGCPVCVLPMGRIDQAIALARDHGVILATYGDLLRVPGPRKTSLMRAKAEGADVRMVYSPMDALALARRHRERNVVFIAIGFETTAPTTAAALVTARAEGLRNFFVFCNHVLTPPAMHHMLTAGDAPVALDGFVGPSHVSTVIGAEAFRPIVERHGKPVVIAGFEPLDLLMAIAMLVRQVNEGRAEVENEYARLVAKGGNAKAQALMGEVFCLRPSFEWRGLGTVPDSALELGPDFAGFDAEARFPTVPGTGRENPACACPDILRGLKTPTDCRLFGKGCTPENPIGSCMVSSEGACAAYYAYGRLRAGRGPEEARGRREAEMRGRS